MLPLLLEVLSVKKLAGIFDLWYQYLISLRPKVVRNFRGFWKFSGFSSFPLSLSLLLAGLFAFSTSWPAVPTMPKTNYVTWKSRKLPKHKSRLLHKCCNAAFADTDHSPTVHFLLLRGAKNNTNREKKRQISATLASTTAHSENCASKICVRIFY